jgi:flagellar biosynthesis anti-sigma factor FlgM
MDMNVSRVAQAYGEYIVNRSGAAGKSDKVRKDNGDSVAFSQAAVEFQTARKALDAVADIREDKVKAAQMKLAKGNFEINATAVADKIFAKEESERETFKSLYKRDFAV